MQSRHHLRRVLYENKKNSPRAVDELRRVTESDPKNIKANYYLGQAIRALVEQHLLQETQHTFASYVQKGAPLGNLEEVQEFLNTQKANAQQTKATR